MSAGANQTGYVPADGVNTEHVEYYFAGGYVCPMDPGAELPISRVYDLVGEYVQTGERPAGVEWVELPA
ncbi:Imm1 family immunity protein [Saccharopolyspora mangrovi]|uniref:Imm1 family immunity protein n=1 Tax=Saccharopolyspora mangrovi TaxID=3082379 RepID=A0ABU6AJ57_9PSEU|nr:Imm1 family immunity protein [Saccharopolyspora sp. S2-29]MEB3371555.1 Imm1 family immunity protein [Saccharopolyspora sp. S2-29]